MTTNDVQDEEQTLAVESEEKETVAIPEDEEFERSIEELIAGKRISFEALGKTFYIRQPTDIERDDATLLQLAARQEAKAKPYIAKLYRQPLPQPDLDEIDKEIAECRRRKDVPELDDFRKRWFEERIKSLGERRVANAGESLVESAASIARNRFLAARLLQFEDGTPVVTKKVTWESLHPQLQDSATMATARMMRYLYLIPFDSVQVRGPS